MKRLLSYYHPKLPLYFVGMLQQVKYEPKLFLDWVCKFPDLETAHRQKKLKKSLLTKLLILWGYYIYVLQLIAAGYLAWRSIFGGIVFLLILPLVIAGSLYVLAIAYQGVKYLKEYREKKS